MTTSPILAASATGATLCPSFSARAQLLPPLYSPTTTSCPESRRLRAWAWPWLPYPMIAIIGYGSQGHAHALNRSEEHTSELQSRLHLVCRLLPEKKKNAGLGGVRVALQPSGHEDDMRDEVGGRVVRDHLPVEGGERVGCVRDADPPVRGALRRVG